MRLEEAYRPETVEEVFGNDSLIESLLSVLNRKEETRPRVYLFYGQAGCGKTTLARIIKKHISCADCDYYEIDASNDRGIDAIRSLKRKIQYSPISGGSRMITFDECHGVTPAAQEAMLKMLEQPPPKCYFALCTTEPQSLKPTIMRRCKKYEVRPLFPQEMREFIRAVVDAEGKEISEDTVEKLVKVSHGSPGSMLSYLDQVIDVPSMQAKEVLDDMTLNEDVVSEVYNILIDTTNKGRWSKLAPLLKRMSQDPEQARRYMKMRLGSLFLMRGNHVIAEMLGMFTSPFYDSGKEGFILACYFCLIASGDTEPF